ncbi:hypothetical protein [Thalassobaculum sp.]|uniref:hypothetical protein n=1 Tax=Thalassobaculum sp. TaxID=2022740 RepID=UPI0032EFA0A0
MTEAWSPLLTEPPEFAGPLLSGLRLVLPTLFNAALQAPESATKPHAMRLNVADDPTAAVTVVGHDLRRAEYGPRDALFLAFNGDAQFRNGALRVSGEAVLDLATNAILRLHLTEPVAL